MRQMEENARQNVANAAEKPQAIIDQEELNRKTVEEARRFSQESARQNAATNEATNKANQEASQRHHRRTAPDEVARASAASPPPCPPYEEATCHFSGNQHLRTYHGERFDFMGVGAFTLAKLDDAEVQGFLCPAVESAYPFAFRGVSYLVALAIRKAGRTLLLDEKEVVHLPDGSALEPEQRRLTSALEERRPRRAGEEASRGASALEERHGSSGAGASTFTATRFASQSTGAWAWNISWQGGHLLAHKVAASNHSLTGGVQVGWLTLGGESALTRAEGLCSRPCASTSADATATVGGVELKVSVGGCQNTACQRMDLDAAADDSPLLFDPATLARLESACQTAGTKPPICSAEEQACICHAASCACMMSRTKAGLSAGNMCMHMHAHSAPYTLHVRTSTTAHTSRPTHQVDSADSPTSCVAGSKEHAQAQAACASLDNAACAAYHDDCVKDHCAGWSTALEARTYT